MMTNFDEIDSFLIFQGKSVRETIEKICKNNGYGLFVVDEESKLVGAVTDGNIRRAILKGISVEEKVDLVMNGDLLFCNFEEDDVRVGEIFKYSNKGVTHVPKVDKEGRIIKIFSRLDFEAKGRFSFVHDIFEKNFEVVGSSRSVLVTGGGGYIGSVLVSLLLSRGYIVYVLDRFLFGKNIFDNYKNKDRLFLHEGDVGNISDVVSVCQNVDSVVHLAEIVGDPACAIDPKETQQVNFLSTSLLAQVCKYLNINRFVYASSCSVYGASEEDQLLNESSFLNPVSLYARMKVESEKLLFSLKDSVFSPTVLRFATVFGLSPRMRFDLVVNVLTAKAAQEGKITIFGGDQWRPHVHVRDIGKAIIKVLEAPIQKVSGEVFNVGGNNNNHTINEVGKIVKNEFPLSELLIQEKEIDKRNYKVDFAKISSVLGYFPERSVSDGVIEIKKACEAGDFSHYSSDEYSNFKTYKGIHGIDD